MTNDDVIKLVKGGLDEAQVVEIGVRFDDGSSRIFTQDMHPSWSAGNRVRLVNGALVSM